MNKTHTCKHTKCRAEGFSLVEILISLLVLSGAIATMFSGFEYASQLDFHSSFESYAAYLAEREIELTKSDLLSEKILPVARAIKGRFQYKSGYKVSTAISTPDEYGAVRLISSIKNGERSFNLESFVFVPNARQQIEKK